MSRRHALGLLAAAGTGLFMPETAQAAPAALPGTGIFGYSEVRRTGSGRFPKWKGAIDRTLSERGALSQPCQRSAVTRCDFHDWQALIEDMRATPRTEQLHRVNLELNRRAYILDPINWGVPDYWASPAQFFRKNGDCEDFSIAKYMSLRDLGIAPSEMRIVVLNDENLRIPHAILAVRNGGDELILDNQINQVVSHRVIRHYRPIFSINEEAWWLHR